MSWLFSTVLAVAVLGQESPRFSEEYDRFHDVSTQMVELGVIGWGRGWEVDLTVVQFSPGRSRLPGQIKLWFSNTTEVANGWRYLRNHDVVLLVDGQRMRFSPRHEGEVHTQGHYLTEDLFVTLSPEQSRILGHAKRIEAKIGSDEWTAKPGHVRAIRKFWSDINQSRIQP